MAVINWILEAGASVMLPIVIIILALLLGEKPGKAIRSGIMIGIGFVGIGLVVDLMLENLGPAAQAMAERFGVELTVIDVGWPGASPMTWASQIGSIAIPVAVLVNILMLLCGLTKVVNVDIWNVWHMAFTGALLHIATDNFWIGVVGVVIHAALVYKLGDWFAPLVEDYYELDGIAIPHGTSAYLGPIAIPFEWLVDKIPGIRDININAEKIEEKLGVFGEPIIIGGILGLFISLLAGYSFQQALQLSITTAAVMELMPKMVKCIMEGLMPVSEAARKMLSKKFAGKQFYIGLDPALLLGDSQVVAASLIFIPLTILIALIVPGNKVLPFGDLATIGFFVAMAVAVHKGNIFRTIISGSVIMYLTIWISTQTIPYHTVLAQNAGQQASAVASLDQGGSPITYILLQIFKLDNLLGLSIIGVAYIACLVCTYSYYKSYKNKLGVQKSQ
ncbi:MAG: PTS galactitol transporter subunit IIC [Tissierellia bacterium]|nr:PTS galactitol transporter subunit IIC [Tissierellia bacterium]